MLKGLFIIFFTKKIFFTASDKVLTDKAFNVAKNHEYDGYQRGLTSMVYKSFDEKTSGEAIKSMQNQKVIKQLLENFKK